MEVRLLYSVLSTWTIPYSINFPQRHFLTQSSTVVANISPSRLIDQCGVCLFSLPVFIGHGACGCGGSLTETKRGGGLGLLVVMS
jgi:hypothetical protein